MDKVVKRELKLAFNCLECKKPFILWHDGEGLVTTICPKCHLTLNTTGEKEESEKSVSQRIPMGFTHRESNFSTDSRDSFWNSYPIKQLTPEQRKHFKAIMRKEVRSK